MQGSGATTFARAARMAGVALLATVLALAASASAASAQPALAGQWRFDEAAGQAVLDDGPFGLPGTLGASGRAGSDDPSRIPGASGGALRFDGRNAHVRVDDARRLDLQKLTVEAVARADGSPGAYRYLVAHGSRNCFSGAYGLYTAREGGLAFYVFDGERYFVSATARPEDVWDGAWHRLTGTFDGSAVRVFVDGRQVGEAHETPVGTAIENDSMPEGTHFGTYVGSCRLPFRGDLDSVSIWSDAADPGRLPAPRAPSGAGAPSSPVGPGVPGSPAAPAAPAAPIAPAAARPTVIKAAPPAASCRVAVSRRYIRAGRRSPVALRARTRGGRPIRNARLWIRRANGKKVLAVRRTNRIGRTAVTLRISGRARLRISILGRRSCTPAFVKVSRRR